MLSLRVGATWNGGAPTGGRWLHGLVPFGGLSFSTAFQRATDSTGGGGMHVISWEMALPGNLPLPTEVRQDCLVELFAGPCSLGAAVIAETPRGNTVTADGLFRLGEYFQAVDGLGLPTTDVDEAVTTAIAAGLRWVDPGDLPTGALSSLSSDSVQFNTVSGLLNAYCKANNKIWHIDRSHTLRIVDAPNLDAPDWALSPLIPNPQTADSSFVSTYFIRRTDGVNVDGQPNAWAANSATDPDAPMIRQEAIDVSDLGYLSSGDGDAVAEAYLEANKSRPAFTEGMQVAPGQQTTLGGTAPELWDVMAGQVVQQSNWMTATGDLVLGDRRTWAIGGTQWKQGEPLTVTPMGLAPRTVETVTQAQGGRRNRLAFQ